MVTFLLLAGVLLIVGIALVAIPLLRRRAVTEGLTRESPVGTPLAPATWTALVAAGVLVIGSAVLYAVWTNWSWRAPAAADSPENMVAGLARKLERNPDDLQGWLMLGNSYVVLQQYPLAVRAFERADRLAEGKNAVALVGEAEALTMNDESELTGRAGRLIEQALQLDPTYAKALFFGGAAAVRRGELALGKERFQKLLSLNPPEGIKPILQQQIDAIDQRMSGKGGAEGPAMASASEGSGSAGSASASAAADSKTAVLVHIELAPSLSNLDPTGASPLFVFVRDPAQPGPPLAAKRLASHFPQDVRLTPSDSMVPGRAFGAGQKVQVVARIARSGNPIGGSGDPFGEVAYRVGHDGLVNIVIDHVTP